MDHCGRAITVVLLVFWFFFSFIPQYLGSTLQISSGIKKCMLFQKTSAAWNWPAWRSPPKLLSLQVDRKSRKERNKTQWRAAVGLQTELLVSPVLQRGWMGAHSPRSAAQGRTIEPSFPIASFLSGSFGSLDIWHRDVPAGFKLVQHFFPVKFSLLCFLSLYCSLLWLLQPSLTFSFGFPLPLTSLQACLHWKVIEYPLVDFFGKYNSARSLLLSRDLAAALWEALCL